MHCNGWWNCHISQMFSWFFAEVMCMCCSCSIGPMTWSSQMTWNKKELFVQFVCTVTSSYFQAFTNRSLVLYLHNCEILRSYSRTAPLPKTFAQKWKSVKTSVDFFPTISFAYLLALVLCNIFINTDFPKQQHQQRQISKEELLTER